MTMTGHKQITGFNISYILTLIRFYNFKHSLKRLFKKIIVNK